MSAGNLRWLVVPTVAAFLIGQLGCASRPIRVSPPSDQPRPQLGTVGVVSARSTPESKYWTSTDAGRGAVEGLSKGAKIGAKVGFWPGAIAGGLVGTLAALAAGGGGSGGGVGVLGVALVVGGATAGASALVAAPVGAAVGAVRGALKAPPRAAVKKAEAELATILADLNIQEAMRDQIIQLVQEQTQHFVLLTDQGLTAHDTETSYRSLSGEGIDTVLELGVSAIELSGPWGLNPRGALLMTVRARLIQVADGAELYARDFEYAGGVSPFVDLADNPGPLREELQLASQNLAKEIVGELLSRFTPIPKESPPVHEEERQEPAIP